jgi:hypothetical protein
MIGIDFFVSLLIVVNIFLFIVLLWIQSRYRNLLNQYVKLDAMLYEYLSKYNDLIIKYSNSMKYKKNELDEELEQHKYINSELEKIKLMTQEQIELSSHLDRPSTGPTHSLYKNELVQRIKDIEEEKILILKKISDKKLNPIIRIFNHDTKKYNKIKLSELIDKMIKESVIIDDNTSIKKTNLKLVVNKEDDDDRSSKKISKFRPKEK